MVGECVGEVITILSYKKHASHIYDNDKVKGGRLKRILIIFHIKVRQRVSKNLIWL